MKEVFPSITWVSRILLTKAANNVSAESANSALRHVKADFINMIGEKRLNALLLVHIHLDIFLDYNKIIVMYASICPKRMFLINLLSES